MPTYNIIGTNKNSWGGEGRFEADRSSWGFANTSFFNFQRTSIYKTEGNFGGYGNLISIPGIYSTLNSFLANWSIGVAGQKFLATAKVRVTSGANLLGSAGNKISIKKLNADLTETELIATTFGDCTDTWVEIQTVFTIADPGVWFHQIAIQLENDGGGETLNSPGWLFVDEFYVYPAEEIADPACDLEIDVGSTVIVHESGPAAADGSIAVAVTGGTAPFEYSKNNGSTWQSSNLFAGLDNGIYQVKVREQADPACEASQSFSVNEGTIAFDFTTIVSNESITGAGDGQIEITVIGPGTPFTFSKDGGDSYQGSNIFSSLTPGIYTIAVKDTSGNVVAKNVLVGSGQLLFEKIYFSKNPIPLTIGAQSGYGALTNYRGYDDVRVEDVADSGTYVSKMTQMIEPDSAGQLKFSLRQAFRGVLTATPPTSNEAIKRLTDRIKFYRNFTGHLQDEQLTPSSLTIGNPFVVMLGGIDKLRFPTINYFTEYLPTNKKFLTWAPIDKEVQRLQEDYLNFWVYALAITTLKVIIKAYYDDDTNQTSTLSTTSVKYGQLYQIPAGPANSGVFTINPAKNLIKYELWLTDQTDSLISEVRTYRLAPFTHPLTRYFMFLNSLGAYEVLYFKGQAEITARVQKEIIQKHLSNDYSALQGEFESNNATLRDEGNYASGFFKGPLAAAWQEYMKDFLLSSRVYEIVGQSRKPVNVITDNFPFKIDQDYKHGVQFRTTDAYESDSYTPASI